MRFHRKIPPSSHDEFVAQRKQLVDDIQRQVGDMAIGGSDICKMLKLAYGVPGPLVHVHRGDSAPKEIVPSGPMLDGIRYEQVAVFLWNLLNPDDPVSRVTTQVHFIAGIPFLVSVDGLLLNSRRIFEVKTLAANDEHGFTQTNQLNAYGLPLKYIGQLELYMDAYKYDQAVMMFLMPNQHDNRQVYEMILRDPMAMRSRLNLDIVSRLFFTRHYERPSFDLWFWIVGEIMTFKEIVNDCEYLFDAQSCDQSKVAVVTRKEREQEYDDISIAGHGCTMKRPNACPMVLPKDPRIFWFRHKEQTEAIMNRLLFERKKRGYCVDWNAAYQYIPPAHYDTIELSPKETQTLVNLICTESLFD